MPKEQLSSLTLSRFRRSLRSKQIVASEKTLLELEQRAAETVKFFIKGKKPPRSALVAREIKAFVKASERAARAISNFGSDGLTLILTAASAKRELGDINPEEHAAYYERMARLAKKALPEATFYLKSMPDRGGATPDENLNGFVTIMMDHYQEILAIKPEHTIDVDTGKIASPCGIYIQEALKIHAPIWEPTISKLDKALRLGLKNREFEPFSTPF